MHNIMHIIMYMHRATNVHHVLEDHHSELIAGVKKLAWRVAADTGKKNSKQSITHTNIQPPNIDGHVHPAAPHA